MGNFHIYSIHEQVAHNSYLEIAAELGIAGLAAYLLLIFTPLRSLRRIQRERAIQAAGFARNDPEASRSREIHYLSIALQGVLFAYIVCSFFGSIQYQWFLYYPVAYAIALRRIHESERAASNVPHETAFVAARNAIQPRGVVWKEKREVAAITIAARSGSLNA
jgi:Na+/H+ antiporter NhaD/arsenite permease-like protein